MNHPVKIGGYFEIELSKQSEYHSNAIKLNSGRSCLDYLLRLYKFEKIYLPYFSCNSLLDVIIKNNVAYEFYRIDTSFQPVFDKHLNNTDAFLYINFFGLSSGLEYVASENVIIDNSQAFFKKPEKSIPTFYSPRKFFGVSDGGYLYSSKALDTIFEIDKSSERCGHLLARADGKVEEGYEEYKKNEAKFGTYGIRYMSELTQKILSSIDYSGVIAHRNSNFIHLHSSLKHLNALSLDVHSLNGPLIYPLLLKDQKDLREFLRQNRIYSATYWTEVLDRIDESFFEYNLVNNLVALPIDQRYTKSHMEYIIKNILEFVKKK